MLGTRAQVNKSELKELRHVCDCSKVLESEHASLQQQNKEQEAQADEWEQCVNKHEVALADVQAALEDAKHCIVQLIEGHADANAAEEQLAKVHSFCSSLPP